MDAARVALVGLSAVAVVLASAKAHGRQVRLVRERAGILEITFGGDTPPFVEALWRKDRVRFWTAYPILAVVLGATVLVLACPCPTVPWATLALAAGPWAFAGAFFVAGVPHVPEAPRGTLRASILWWSTAALLGTLSVVLAGAAHGR